MAGVKTKDATLREPTVQQLLARGGKIEFGTYAFDSEYATGGEALDFTAVGWKANPVICIFEPKGGYVFEYDRANGKVMAKGQTSNAVGALVEIAVSTDLSALSDVPYLALGW